MCLYQFDLRVFVDETQVKYMLIDIEFCEDSPCGAGTCTELLTSYTCACPEGYSGDNCQNGE